MSSDQPQDPASPPSLPPIYRLSQELVDEIIDTLHFFAEEECRPAHRWDYLTNCALVCRSFAPRAQMHLFTQISLPGTAGSRWIYSRVATLLEILENNPTIAKHIQNLNLKFPLGDTSCLYQQPEMLTIMQMINSTEFPVSSLLLRSEPISYLKDAAYHDSGFRRLHRFFEQAISPYITTLHIECINSVPVVLVTMSTHLQDLKMIYCTFTFHETGVLDQDTDQPLSFKVERNRRPKIKVLEYRLSPDYYGREPKPCIPRLLTDPSLLDLSSLKSLTTFMDKPVRNLDLAQKIMDTSKGSIEEVMIQIYEYKIKLKPFPSTFLNFANQPKLQSLSCTAIFYPAPRNASLGTTRNKVGGIHDICMMLETIASPSSGYAISCLRTLELTLVVPHTADDELLGDEDWEKFINEVKRIASLSRPAGERLERQPKLELWLNMYYRGLFGGENDSDLGYAIELMNRLIDERLESLKDCVWVTLERRVDTLD